MQTKSCDEDRERCHAKGALAKTGNGFTLPVAEIIADNGFKKHILDSPVAFRYTCVLEKPMKTREYWPPAQFLQTGQDLDL